MNDAIESYCPDLLWVLAEPLLPVAPRPEQGGGMRRIHPDRAILAAVVYKGKTGCASADVPRSAFGAPRSTLHERFSTWVRSGFLEALLAAIHKEAPARFTATGADCRAALRQRGVIPRIARKGIE